VETFKNIQILSRNVQKYSPLCVKQAEGKIPRNKYQISNKYQLPKYEIQKGS